MIMTLFGALSAGTKTYLLYISAHLLMFNVSVNSKPDHLPPGDPWGFAHSGCPYEIYLRFIMNNAPPSRIEPELTMSLTFILFLVCLDCRYFVTLSNSYSFIQISNYSSPSLIFKCQHEQGLKYLNQYLSVTNLIFFTVKIMNKTKICPK